MRILFVLLVLTLVGCAPSSVKIGNLEVMTEDLGDIMNLQAAEGECDYYGDGWRLPTIEELKIMCENKDVIGGFVSDPYMDDMYWSSDEMEKGGSTYPMSFYFYSCREETQLRDDWIRVRLVRTAKP